MRKKRVWRYYCDFCKHAKCRSVEKHEAHCTANPNRLCGMCKWDRKEPKPIAELKAALTKGLETLRQVTQCPACILAAIRQSGSTSYEYEFDYRAEGEAYWGNLQAKWQREAEYEAIYG